MCRKACSGRGTWHLFLPSSKEWVRWKKDVGLIFKQFSKSSQITNCRFPFYNSWLKNLKSCLNPTVWTDVSHRGWVTFLIKCCPCSRSQVRWRSSVILLKPLADETLRWGSRCWVSHRLHRLPSACIGRMTQGLHKRWCGKREDSLQIG